MSTSIAWLFKKGLLHNERKPVSIMPRFPMLQTGSDFTDVYRRTASQDHEQSGAKETPRKCSHELPTTPHCLRNREISL